MVSTHHFGGYIAQVLDYGQLKQKLKFCLTFHSKCVLATYSAIFQHYLIFYHMRLLTSCSIAYFV